MPWLSTIKARRTCVAWTAVSPTIWTQLARFTRSIEVTARPASLLSAAGHGNAVPTATMSEPAWTPPPAASEIVKSIDSAGSAVAYRRLVRKLVDEASQELSQVVAARKHDVESDETADTLLPYTQEEEQHKGREIIADKVKRHITFGIESGSGAIDAGAEKQLAQDVYNTIFGLGPLQVLVDDPTIEKYPSDRHEGRGHVSGWAASESVQRFSIPTRNSSTG